MTGIVERLNALANHIAEMDSGSGDAKLLWDAADEITRLASIVDFLSQERQFGEPKTFMGIPMGEAMKIVIGHMKATK